MTNNPTTPGPMPISPPPPPSQVRLIDAAHAIWLIGTSQAKICERGDARATLLASVKKDGWDGDVFLRMVEDAESENARSAEIAEVMHSRDIRCPLCARRRLRQPIMDENWLACPECDVQVTVIVDVGVGLNDPDWQKVE